MIFLSNCCTILLLRETGDDQDLLAGKSGPCISSSPLSHVYFEHQQHPEFTELRGRDIEQQKSYFVTRCNTGQWEEARLSVKVKMEPGKLILCFSLLLEGVLMKYTNNNNIAPGQRKHFVTCWHRDICVTGEPWHVTHHTVSRSLSGENWVTVTRFLWDQITFVSRQCFMSSWSHPPLNDHTGRNQNQ